MDHLADGQLSRFKYASVGIVGASTGQYLLFKDWEKLSTSYHNNGPITLFLNENDA